MNVNHGIGMGFGWIFAVLILILIVWFIARTFNQGRKSVRNKSAFDILKERYASGEITKEEFEDKKKDIR